MSLSLTTARLIELAIVRFSSGGRGVLVPGGFIVSAAHCIGWSAEGYMAFENQADLLQEVETAAGKKLTLYPRMVEPISDLAVLEAPDVQWIPEATAAFSAFSKTARAVPLALDPLVFGRLSRRTFSRTTVAWCRLRSLCMTGKAPCSRSLPTGSRAARPAARSLRALADSSALSLIREICLG